MIQVERLTRRYGTLVALDGVTIEVHPGEAVGLLGANGAGKTTLLRTVAGLQLPDSGSVRIGKADIVLEPERAKAQLGYAAEEPSFYEELAAEEYLAFLASVRGLDPSAARRRAGELAEMLGLAGRTNEAAHRYSHGMRKKLSFIAAILHEPGALLCDEALEGFDVSASLAAKEEIRRMVASGCAVVFSSHVTETIERLCDRALILHRGRLARSLERSDWGGQQRGPSLLEREFLAVARTESQGSTS